MIMINQEERAKKMTVGDLKKQFERLGANDDSEVYLVMVTTCERDTEYEAICVSGFQQKGVGIFFNGRAGKEVDYG